MPITNTFRIENRSPFRTEIAQLATSNTGPYADGWNDALRKVLAIFDTSEEQRKIESKDGLDERKREGKKTGGYVRYGYEIADTDGTLREHRGEQRVISRARDLRRQGKKLAEIGEDLIKHNMLPRKVMRDGVVVQPKRWLPGQIKRILDDEMTLKGPSD